MGKADIWILFSKILYLELVKSTRIWNQLFKCPVLWGWGHTHCLMASGNCGLLGAIPGPLRSGHSEWHLLCGPRPPSGSWCRLLHQLLTCYEDTNFIFRYVSALPPLPNLLSFLPLSSFPSHQHLRIGFLLLSEVTAVL